MRLIISGLAALLLSGCITDRGADVRFYTAADIDAMNARTQCRAIARNLVQMTRCDAR